MDLLDFVRQHYNGDLLAEIGERPKEWIEELSLINQMLTGYGLVAMIDDKPPADVGFRQIGQGVFIYSGDDRRSRGLWISKAVPDHSEGHDSGKTRTSWNSYRLGGRARVELCPGFKDISIDDLLPQNFEPRAEAVKCDKRPVLRFSVNNQGVEQRIYAKGSQILTSLYYEDARPYYRLTPLAGVQKVSSLGERRVTEMLRGAGISVPGVVGIYTAPCEDFLFVTEVAGERPDKCFGERAELVRQDAEMLAKLCRLGLRKQGFEDFDDKLFDGRRLYLIDVDEMVGLYDHAGIDFKEIVLNPDGRLLKEFRRYQRSLFCRMVKDAVYSYRKSLLPDRDSREMYVSHFFRELGWGCSSDKMSSILAFPENYSTLGSDIALAHD